MGDYSPKTGQKTMTNAKDQAQAQAESIIELLAAANLDFDRLEELREDRINLTETLADQEMPELIEEARATLESWDEENGTELNELEHAAGDYKNQEDAQEAIRERALSVEVRSSWHVPGGDSTAAEFRIVLCTGGPHVEIVGELDSDYQPYRAWIQYQDWGAPMTKYIGIQPSDLIEFCSHFYFGG